MIRRPGHRSSALRVLIGGALAVLLATASSARACTPEAYIVFDNTQQDVMAGVPVKVSGEAFEKGATVEIRVGDTAEEAIAGPLKATGTGPRFVTTVVLDTLGPNTLWPVVVGTNGVRTVPNPDASMAWIRVTEAASSTSSTSSSSTIHPTTTVPAGNPINNDNAHGGPSTSTGTKVPVLDRSRALTAPGASPAARSTPTAASPDAAPAVNPDQSAPDATPAAATADDAPPPALFPDVNDLWSGVDPFRAPTLLDGDGPPPGRGGPVLGVALLGIGVLALAAAGAVAGERRLALARRLRT